MINETPWLFKLARERAKLRKFEMRKYEGHLPDVPADESGRKNKVGTGWGIKIPPSFERNITPEAITELSESARGIYQYLDHDGEVLYIGSGFIRKRFTEDPRRTDWGVARIEYSLLDDDESQFKWENYWQSKFREQNGKLPPLNMAMAPKK